MFNPKSIFKNQFCRFSIFKFEKPTFVYKLALIKFKNKILNKINASPYLENIKKIIISDYITTFRLKNEPIIIRYTKLPIGIPIPTLKEPHFLNLNNINKITGSTDLYKSLPDIVTITTINNFNERVDYILFLVNKIHTLIEEIVQYKEREKANTDFDIHLSIIYNAFNKFTSSLNVTPCPYLYNLESEFIQITDSSTLALDNLFNNLTNYIINQQIYKKAILSIQNLIYQTCLNNSNMRYRWTIILILSFLLFGNLKHIKVNLDSLNQRKDEFEQEYFYKQTNEYISIFEYNSSQEYHYFKTYSTNLISILNSVPANYTDKLNEYNKQKVQMKFIQSICWLIINITQSLYTNMQLKNSQTNFYRSIEFFNLIIKLPNNLLINYLSNLQNSIIKHNYQNYYLSTAIKKNLCNKYILLSQKFIERSLINRFLPKKYKIPLNLNKPFKKKLFRYQSAIINKYKKHFYIAKHKLSKQNKRYNLITVAARFNRIAKLIIDTNVQVTSPHKARALYLFYKFKLRMRLLLQKLFYLKSTKQFINLYKHSSKLNLNKHIINSNQAVLYDYSSTDPADDFAYNFDYNDLLQNKKRNKKKSVTNEVTLSYPLFFISLVIQIRTILYTYFSFPTIATVNFFIRYGLVQYKNSRLTNSYKLLDINEPVIFARSTIIWLKLTYAKSMYTRSTKYSSYNSDNWLIKSNNLPVIIMWRYPTSIDVFNFFNLTYNIKLEERIMDYFTHNPYKNVKL